MRIQLTNYFKNDEPRDFHSVIHTMKQIKYCSILHIMELQNQRNQIMSHFDFQCRSGSGSEGVTGKPSEVVILVAPNCQFDRVVVLV